ncbi:hypothetical protein TRICI_005376 [Trichomonascus ciferrii]|uniref:Retrovirus-related Pol polyprotein from transposon TNT 1-94-like beta-barrel domain-containing protein n=1 Tax=Trichomonascus ciferrii TaxID=44093 RepID=A0A642UT41_9ASCO|nr:hypothetical protein TRICI_005376 [Trichomonascus ciferrii]
MAAANGGARKGAAVYEIDHDAPQVTVAAVRVLRWLWVHDRSFQERTYKRLEKSVPSVSPERIMKSLVFFYLTAVPAGKDSSSILTASVPEMLHDVLSSNFLENRSFSTKQVWEEMLIWGLRTTSIDPYIWNSHSTVQEKFAALGKTTKTAARMNKIRHEYAQRAFAPEMANVKKSIFEIVETTLKITNHMCIDRALNCNVNRFRNELSESWNIVKSIQSMFSCHLEISQPVLLAALLYSGITRPRNGEKTIRNSQQLKTRYPALHRVFYIILECAQSSTRVVDSKKKIQSCDVYSVDPTVSNTSKATTTPNTNANNTPKSSSTKPSSIGSSPLPSEIGTFEGPTVRIEEKNSELTAVVCNYKIPRRIRERSPECAVWTISDLPVHVCCHQKYFVKSERVQNKALVRHKWGELPYKDTFHRIDGVGTVKVKVRNRVTNTFVTLTLENVQYVPSMNFNIMSLPALGASVKYDTGSLEMTFNDGTSNVDPPESKIFLKSMLQQRYWFFDYSRGQDFSQQSNNIPDIQQSMRTQGLNLIKYRENN